MTTPDTPTPSPTPHRRKLQGAITMTTDLQQIAAPDFYAWIDRATTEWNRIYGRDESPEQHLLNAQRIKNVIRQFGPHPQLLTEREKELHAELAAVRADRAHLRGLLSVVLAHWDRHDGHLLSYFGGRVNKDIEAIRAELNKEKTP